MIYKSLSVSCMRFFTTKPSPGWMFLKHGSMGWLIQGRWLALSRALTVYKPGISEITSPLVRAFGNYELITGPATVFITHWLAKE